MFFIYNLLYLANFRRSYLFYLLPTNRLLVILKRKNPSFRLCNIKKYYFLKMCKPQFSVVQTPVFGCANPSFRLCKPQFSVVQTPVFGCAMKIESLNHACLRGVKIAPIYIYIIIIERESK